MTVIDHWLNAMTTRRRGLTSARAGRQSEDSMPGAGSEPLDWSRDLERQGYIELSTYEGVGAKRYTLLPRLVGVGAGLVTIWNDRGASLQFWRSVFERRAPGYIERVEGLAGIRIGKGNTTQQVSEELLEALSEAYAEAAA